MAVQIGTEAQLLAYGNGRRKRLNRRAQALHWWRQTEGRRNCSEGRSPQSPDILESLAGEQALIGKYEEALNTLELASRVGVPSPYAPDLRAFLLRKLGRGPKDVID